MKIGLGIIVASMLLVVLEALVSYYISNNFWPSQVMARWSKAGISFFAHGGMWGDLLLLPALMAAVVVKYGDGWTMKQIAIMAAIGVAITLGNHLLLIFTQVIPDPFGWKSEKWSTLIALHFVYMSIYVALAGLFYFSSGVSVKAAVAVSVVLGIHMMAGTHVFLGLANLYWGPWPWCPQTFLHAGVAWMQLGIWVLLSVLATVAAGWRAGLSVAVIAAIIAAAVILAVRTGQSTLNV